MRGERIPVSLTSRDSNDTKGGLTRVRGFSRG
jgi:hypothetical protein